MVVVEVYTKDSDSEEISRFLKQIKQTFVTSVILVEQVVSVNFNNNKTLLFYDRINVVITNYTQARINSLPVVLKIVKDNLSNKNNYVYIEVIEYDIVQELYYSDNIQESDKLFVAEYIFRWSNEKPKPLIVQRIINETLNLEPHTKCCSFTELNSKEYDFKIRFLKEEALNEILDKVKLKTAVQLYDVINTNIGNCKWQTKKLLPFSL